MCVWWGVVFFIIIILLGGADKTHLIVLCYYVTKTGLVGAAALFPTFHTYLGDKATDCGRPPDLYVFLQKTATSQKTRGR